MIVKFEINKNSNDYSVSENFNIYFSFLFRFVLFSSFFLCHFVLQPSNSTIQFCDEDNSIISGLAHTSDTPFILCIMLMHMYNVYIFTTNDFVSSSIKHASV